MTAENIIKKIQEKIEQEGLNFSSIEELNDFGKKVMDEQNNDPNPDFEGLSPNQMHHILYAPFSKDSIIQFKEKNKKQEIHSPMVDACKKILGKIDPEKGLKLTQKGYLPRDLVKEIHFAKTKPNKDFHGLTISVNKEMDSEIASMAHAMIDISNLVKKRQNKLFLTTKGKEAAADDFLLLKYLFMAFVEKFNKGYLDGYDSDEIGHVGILYVLYLVNKYGQKERNAEFYADKYFTAFPMLSGQIEPMPFETDSYNPSIQCFITRVINRGFTLFGFIHERYERGTNIATDYFIKKTPLLESLFSIKA
jgi:hypothetical protein